MLYFPKLVNSRISDMTPDSPDYSDSQKLPDSPKSHDTAVSVGQ